MSHQIREKGGHPWHTRWSAKEEKSSFDSDNKVSKTCSKGAGLRRRRTIWRKRCNKKRKSYHMSLTDPFAVDSLLKKKYLCVSHIGKWRAPFTLEKMGMMMKGQNFAESFFIPWTTCGKQAGKRACWQPWEGKGNGGGDEEIGGNQKMGTKKKGGSGQ